MKKHKMKILLSGIAALLLVGCSGADKGGEGTGGDIVQPEKVVIETKEKTLEAFSSLKDDAEVSEEILKVSVPAYRLIMEGGVAGTDYVDAELPGVAVKPNGEDGEARKLVFFDELLNERLILVEKNAHLEFKGDAEGFTYLVNKGNMYFPESAKLEPDEQLFSLINYGKIYSIGGDERNILSIEGDYIGKGEDAKIYLGLYVDDKNIISTDKVDIEVLASGKTKIHFVFDEEKIKNREKIDDAKVDEEDYVIRAGLVKDSEGNNVFSIAGETVPVGIHVYELKYQPRGKFLKVDDEKYSQDNVWQLKKKKMDIK